MKKNWLKWTMAAAALVVTMGVASAQTATTPSQPRKSGYVDADKNGVCDNYQNGTSNRGNGMRLRDGSGRGRHGGACNYSGKGMGREGRGQYNGQGPNYVDANKNGVCDYRESVVKK